jgi:cobalt-precorrin 5A hydrolase/precorrin-3B C17-methyltransferase
VAEGAVLAALGPEGTLAAEKQKSERATCALGVRGEGSWREPLPGHPQGQVFVVGLGPGKSAWRTPEAEELIARSTDLVGYGRYLDMLGPLSAGKALHPFALGEEEKRVRVALNLAKEGRAVSVVCSGDPGIYAMASLVYEMIERGEDPGWERLHVQVSPGVSAMQAAAALAGAPLGNDFCAISLSDLLTPWEVIEKRVRAASEGDFTIAFYNPASNRRRTQLLRAKEILLRHRLPGTPVILARNLGREGERVEVLRLGDLSVENIDMLTLVIVGSSQTRPTSGGVYTPRGYSGKTQAPAAPAETDPVQPDPKEVNSP